MAANKRRKTTKINYTDILSNIENSSDESESDNSSDTVAAKVKHPNRIRFLFNDRNVEQNDSSYLNWSTDDPPRNNEPFMGSPGVKIFPEKSDSISEVTSLFIGNDLFQMMCDETNRYYRQNEHKHTPTKLTHCTAWSDVTYRDLKKVFALLIMMGQVRKNKLTDYWSTNPLVETPIFAKTMSRGRFLQIWTYLHFENNENITPETKQLFRIQTVIDYFLLKFNTVYKPKQNLSINENIIPWRDELGFNVLNSNKMTKHGILVRILYEAITGYVVNFQICTKNNINVENTITCILGNCSGLWHHLYINHYYIGIKTAEELLRLKFRVCGTMKMTGGGLPEYFKNINGNNIKYCRSGDVLLQNWNKNKKDITMVTTIHNAQTHKTNKRNKSTGEFIYEPISFIDYNKNMKVVDLADQYLSLYSIFQKSKKWTKKVVFYLFNCAFYNSFRVFSTLNTAKKITYEQFLLKVAESWLHEAYDETTNESGNVSLPTTSNRVSRFDPPGRLSGNIQQHVLRKIVSATTNKFVRKRCRVCYLHNIRRDTMYMCQFCQIPLHMGECFETYHTKKHY